MANDPLARLLRLLALLQGRREWSGAELAGRLEVTGRTIRRDIDRLRALGYPVEGTTGAAGGYRLASGRELPPLLLDDEEAIAIVVGLQGAAGGGVAGADEAAVRALAKLEQILPARLQQRITTLASATLTVALPVTAQADPAALGIVAAACRDHEVIAFEYRRPGGVPMHRRVEPSRLVRAADLWYVVGYDPDREGWRTFRLDRLEKPAPIRRHFVPRPLPAEDAAALVRRSLLSAEYRYTATATVQAPTGVVRQRLPMAIRERLTALDERTCRVRLDSDSLDQLSQDLVAVGADLRIEAPPEVLRHLATVGRRLLVAAGH